MSNVLDKPLEEDGWIISGPVAVGTYLAIGGEQVWVGHRWHESTVNFPYNTPVFVRHRGNKLINGIPDFIKEEDKWMYE